MWNEKQTKWEGMGIGGENKFTRMDFCGNSCKGWETTKTKSHKNKWEVLKKKQKSCGGNEKWRKNNCNNENLSQILIGHKLI